MKKLTGHWMLKAILKCVNGLRIGGSKETQDIGGIDNPIIRHPITQMPYIPGSSIKGKMRSLLEQVHSADIVLSDKRGRDNGKPCDCGKEECMVCLIFGCSSTRNTKTVTRSIFRDCFLTEDSESKLMSLREDLGLPYAEPKTEVAIDRRNSKSLSPRTQERIPAGIEFNLEISFRIFEDDNKDQIFAFIKEGLKLLQNDTLGGSGSRGYGKVEISNLEIVQA